MQNTQRNIQLVKMTATSGVLSVLVLHGMRLLRIDNHSLFTHLGFSYHLLSQIVANPFNE